MLKHFWSLNHKREAPSQIACIGVSWKEHKRQRLKSLESIAVVIGRRRGDEWYGQTEFLFTSALEFWVWIRQRCRRKEPLWLFTHNWHSAAQLAGLWVELENKRLTLGHPVRTTTAKNGKSKTTKAWQGLFAVERFQFAVFVTHKTGTVKCVDTTNYFNASLEELARSFGSASTCSGDDALRETGGRANAVHAARVCWRAMSVTIMNWRKHDQGNWQPTAGRLALSHFRHKFMHRFPIIKDHEQMRRPWQRSGCFGGEVAAWKIGATMGLIHKVDVCGLYASEMMKGNFPRDIHLDAPEGSYDGKMRPQFPSECMATVVVEANHDCPVRTDDGQVCWPKGLVETTLCGAELGDTDRRGQIIEWKGWQWYDCKPIFNEYVTYWWNQRVRAREVADGPADQFSKLMVNALQGKLSARKHIWDNMPDVEAPCGWGHFLQPDPIGGKMSRWRAVCGSAQIERKGRERDDTFPAITAFVCAAGRAYMRSVRAMLPWRSVLVQQTDSFLLTSAGFDALTATLCYGDNRLGCFRHVDTYPECTVHAPNFYEWPGGRCVASVPKSARRAGTLSFSVSREERTAEMIASGTVRDKIVCRDQDLILTRRHSSWKYARNGWAIL